MIQSMVTTGEVPSVLFYLVTSPNSRTDMQYISESRYHIKVRYDVNKITVQSATQRPNSNVRFEERPLL